MEQTSPPVGDRPLPPPPVAAPRPDPAPGGSGFFDSLRRIGVVRTQDRWIGGVAGGLARRFGIDPLLVRGLLFVTALLGGAGLVLYGVAWALLAEESDGRIHLEETVRGRFDAAVLGALAFVVVGANRGTGWNGWWDDRGFGWVNGLLWLAALATVVAIVVVVSGRRRPTGAPSAVGAPPPRPGAGRPVPHPGYGAVPLAAPAAPAWSSAAPPPPAWSGPASSTSHVPPPATTGPGTAAPGPAGATAMRPAQAAVVPPPPSTPPPPPAPPRPPRPRVLGPGVGMVGTVVGLTLLALAALLLMEREGALGQPVLLTALGIGIGLAGLAIMVSGLRGRRSGVLGLLAVVGILAAIPAAVAPEVDDDRFGMLWGDVDGALVSSGETWRPGTVAEARRGLSVRFGDVDVDLTDVPLDGETVEVPIRLGAGDLRVVVPEDAAVTADISLAAGQATWDVDGRQAVAGFPGGRSESYRSDEATDGDVDLAIRITAGAGDVRVVEED